MKLLRKYRPSPALAVALVALFVSLGGVSYGVATGSIDSRELKNNTVRSKDIRNRTIQSKDVKRNSLGSTVVAESKLGKIPVAQNAIHAGDATTLGGQGPGAFFPSSKIVTIPRFVLTNNQTKTLIKNGPLTLTAQCEINQTLETVANQDRAEVLVTTTVNGIAIDANPEQDLVNTNSPASERDIFTTGIQPTGNEEVEASSNAGMVIAPGGQWVASQAFFTAINQTATGDGKCTFAGQLFVN